MRRERIFLGAALAVAGSLGIGLLPSTANALSLSYTFECTADDPTKCNGNTYGITLGSTIDNGDGTFTHQLGVAVRVESSYTGNTDATSALDYLQAIAIKNVGAIPGYSSLLSSPSSLYTFTDDELNGNGCLPPPKSDGRLCATAAPGLGILLGTFGNEFEWIFQFDSTLADITSVHLKYLYVDANGDKVGSLGSFDTGTGDDVPDEPLPEPGTLALLGLGLVGLGLSRRRRA